MSLVPDRVGRGASASGAATGRVRRLGFSAAVFGGLILVLAGMGALGAMLSDPTGPLRTALGAGTVGGAGARVDAAAAQGGAKRAEIAYEDAARSLAAWSAPRRAVDVRPARVLHFSGVTSSPCAGAAGMSGAFYCPRDRTVAFDLRFIEALGRWLRRDAEVGIALMAGRLAAVHLQGETWALAPLETRAQAGAPPDEALARDLALQADCLTGVWARLAGPRLGAVMPELYARVLGFERSVARDQGVRAERLTVGYDLIGAGDLAARAEAFGAGLTASDAACGLPG